MALWGHYSASYLLLKIACRTMTPVSSHFPLCKFLHGDNPLIDTPWGMYYRYVQFEVLEPGRKLNPPTSSSNFGR